MSEPNAQAFIEQAKQALNGGQPGQALELADEALSVDVSNPEATLVRAIALSHLSRVEESTAAFEQAQALDRTSARISYNFAVHLHLLGNLARAREEANRALVQMPNHQGARQLVALIDQQTAAGASLEPSREEPPFQTLNSGGAVPPPIAEYVRPGYEPAEHTLDWVARLGDTWTWIGWGLSLVSLAHLGVTVLVYWNSFMLALNSPSGIAGRPTGPVILLLTVLFWTTLGGILFWMIVDLLDRRGNGFWLVPTVLCCCGFSWASLMLYMALGRRPTNQDN